MSVADIQLPDGKLHDEEARVAALHRYDVLDTEPEAPFDKITNLVKMLLSVPMSAVSLVDTNRQWFKSKQGLDVCETSRDISFCTHAIQSREPMLVPDATQDARFADNPLVKGPPGIRSYAGVPLKTPDGYNVGSLCALDTVPREFERGQIELLCNLAALVVDELELRRIAESDYLTGAMTRRAFIAHVEKAIAKYRRTGTSSTLLLLDIDRFKSVNDTFGHAAGDTVLKAVSARCQEVIRSEEVFGRLGGEEFAVLLQGTNASGAMVAAERLRLAIEDMEVPGEPPLKVTASFGVSVLSGDHAMLSAVTPEAWLAIADQGLYTAKASGRNRCCLAA